MVKLVYYKGELAGAIWCNIKTSRSQRRLYIRTIACYERFQGRGVGSFMMDHIIDYAEKDGELESIYLLVAYIQSIHSLFYSSFCFEFGEFNFRHVNTKNKIAIRFYTKYGFQRVKTLRGYYTESTPWDGHDGYIFERKIEKNVDLHSETEDEELDIW